MGLVFAAGVARDGFALVLPGKQWRFDGDGAMCRASACAPGKPGIFTAATLPNVRGFLDDIEVPIALEPMRGSFHDGSYRSVGIQFRSVASFLKRSFRVEIWSTPRSVENTLTWIEPTWDVPEGQDATDWPAMKNMAVFALTDPEYLCESVITLMPLVPAAEDHANIQAWTDTMVEFWNEGTRNGTASGTSTYEHGHGCYAMYCRTGDLSWYEWGHKWSVQVDGPIPGTSSAFHSISAVLSDASNATCVNNELINPELAAGSLNNGTCYATSEMYSLRQWSCVTGYWLSSWRAPVGHIAWGVNRACFNSTTEALIASNFFNANGGARFNFGRILNFWIAGYLTECTREFNTPGGLPAGTLGNYPQYLTWIIDAFENRPWANPATPYLAGVVGLKDTIINDDLVNGVENFQMCIIAEFLILIYDHLYPDSRIPGMLLTLGNYMESQCRVSKSGEAGFPTSWTTPYTSQPPASVVDGSHNQNGYTIGMHAPLFGWLWANTGQAKWRDLLDNATLPANVSGLGKTTKHWGEVWGGMRQSAGYYRAGGAVRGTPGVHPTTMTQPPYHATVG